MVEIYEKVKKTIDESQNIAIIFNSNFEDEYLCAALAYFVYLKKNKKNVAIFTSNNQATINNKFSFLPHFSDINKPEREQDYVVKINIPKESIKKIKYKTDDNGVKFIISHLTQHLKSIELKAVCGFEYDCVIYIGIQDEKYIQNQLFNKDILLSTKSVLNFDYNKNNVIKGTANYIDTATNSIAEIIYKILDHENSINTDTATCLLTSIIARTNYFRNQYVSANILKLSATLMQHGANKEHIINKLHEPREIKLIQEWGQHLLNLQSSHNNQVAWFQVNSVSQNHEPYIIELVDELIVTAKGVKIIVVFYEIIYNNINKSCALLFANNGFSFNKTAIAGECFANNKVAKVTSETKIEELTTKVLDMIGKLI
ncbi:hypothetical protein ISS03_01030 [Patescibacteria group bacterium]|nr:hypothetical protein [Patescibacteria group bacterium]